MSYDYKKLEKNISSTKVFLEWGVVWIINRLKLCWETFKERKFHQESYQSFEEEKKSVSKYMRYYNNYRYSESLNVLSRKGFRKQTA